MHDISLKLNLICCIFTDGLVDCADSECCSRPECKDSLMCLTSPEPLDILLRKQPPSPTASFFQKMQFLIDEDGVQNYARENAFSEGYVCFVEQESQYSHLLSPFIYFFDDILLIVIVIRD